MEMYLTPLDEAEEALQQALIELGKAALDSSNRLDVARNKVRLAQEMVDLEKALTHPGYRGLITPSVTAVLHWDPVDNWLTLVGTEGGKTQMMRVIDDNGDIDQGLAGMFFLPERVKKALDRYELRVKLVKREESDDTAA